MAKPIIAGAGALRVQGVSEDVDYRLQPGAGRHGGKGQVTGCADHMRAAFREGRVMLKLDDGQQLPILVTAHTEGGDIAYFEF